MQCFVNNQYYPKFAIWFGSDGVETAALGVLETLMFISGAIWIVFVERN